MNLRREKSGLGFRVRVAGLRLKVWGLWLRGWGLGFRAKGLGFQGLVGFKGQNAWQPIVQF